MDYQLAKEQVINTAINVAIEKHYTQLGSIIPTMQSSTIFLKAYYTEDFLASELKKSFMDDVGKMFSRNLEEALPYPTQYIGLSSSEGQPYVIVEVNINRHKLSH